jgi:hypothetical protein
MIAARAKKEKALNFFAKESGMHTNHHAGTTLSALCMKRAMWMFMAPSIARPRRDVDAWQRFWSWRPR